MPGSEPFSLFPGTAGTRRRQVPVVVPEEDEGRNDRWPFNLVRFLFELSPFPEQEAVLARHSWELERSCAAFLAVCPPRGAAVLETAFRFYASLDQVAAQLNVDTGTIRMLLRLARRNWLPCSGILLLFRHGPTAGMRLLEQLRDEMDHANVEDLPIRTHYKVRLLDEFEIETARELLWAVNGQRDDRLLEKPNPILLAQFAAEGARALAAAGFAGRGIEIMPKSSRMIREPEDR